MLKMFKVAEGGVGSAALVVGRSEMLSFGLFSIFAI